MPGIYSQNYMDREAGSAAPRERDRHAGRKVHIWIPEQLHRQIAELAAARRVKLSNLVRTALRSYLVPPPPTPTRGQARHANEDGGSETGTHTTKDCLTFDRFLT